MLQNKQSQSRIGRANLLSYFITCVNILDRYYLIIYSLPLYDVFVLASTRQDGFATAVRSGYMRERFPCVFEEAQSELSI